jgi:polyhydroxyalkanoate synthesis regulator phasin
MIGVMGNKKTIYEKAKKVLAERDPYVGVVLEKMKGDIKIISEGYEGVQDRIDRLDGKVNKLEVRVDQMEEK